MSQCRIQILVFTLSYHFSFVMSNLLAPYICNVCAESWIPVLPMFLYVRFVSCPFLPHPCLEGALSHVRYCFLLHICCWCWCYCFFFRVYVFFFYLNYLHKLRCQKMYNRQLSVWICFVHLLIFQTFWLILSSCSLNFKSLPLLSFSLYLGLFLSVPLSHSLKHNCF